MMTASQEFHGEDELYWYPGTPVMSENKRFGCDAADAIAGNAKLIIITLIINLNNRSLTFVAELMCLSIIVLSSSGMCH
ncbi:hypothetical protein MKMG_02136 [Methanogenium sp. MK-MG]|nr:hypothetical protein MKMG_02136 [Methanogenium sp. MK-MG]